MFNAISAIDSNSHVMKLNAVIRLRSAQQLQGQEAGPFFSLFRPVRNESVYYTVGNAALYRRVKRSAASSWSLSTAEINNKKSYSPLNSKLSWRLQGQIHIYFKLLNPTDYMMYQQFNIQQLYALPTLYLCVLYLSENKQRLVSLTA